MAPTVLMLPVVAFNVNVLPAVVPAPEALRLIVPALESSTYTVPVDVAATFNAFVEFGAVTLMPAVPEFKAIVVALRTPVVVMPLAAALALSVKVVPELAPN